MMIKLVLNTFGYLIGLIGRFIPSKQKSFVIASFPDFDDNTKCLVKMGLEFGLTPIILVRDSALIAPSWAKGLTVKKYSIKGLLSFYQAENAFYTHGLYPFLPLTTRPTIMNLWHGMPIKKIGLMDRMTLADVPRFHYTIATNTQFQEIVATSFGVSPSKVWVLEAPRIDLIFNYQENKPIRKGRQYLGVWLPTFRTSMIGDIRTDGDPNEDIFGGEIDLSSLDALFSRLDIHCVAKPHPMSKSAKITFSRYSSIEHLNADDLLKMDFTLYELLGASDFIITDISSVLIDYQSSGKPIFVHCPDLKRYEISRGFTMPLNSFIDTTISKTISELSENIEMHFKNNKKIIEKMNSKNNGYLRTLRIMEKLQMFEHL